LVIPGFAQVDVHKAWGGGVLQYLGQRLPRGMVALAQGSEIDERGSCGFGCDCRACRVDEVVGLPGQDFKAVSLILDMNLYPSRGHFRVNLDSGNIHALVFHAAKGLNAKGVVSQTGDHKRSLTEGCQMPGDVERCAAENRAVGKNVRQDFSKKEDG